MVFVLWVGGMSRLPVDADYTAGELLDHVMAWRSGDALYPDPTVTPYRVFNYPPTVLTAVRALGGLGVDPLLAGRLIGTLGMLAALIVLYRWLRDDGFTPLTALGVVALSGASFPMLYSAGQFHLEGFAVAATLAGFRHGARTTRRDAALAGVFLAVGCLVKQTQVIPALVALAWFARYRRGDLLAAIVPFAVVGIAGCMAITMAFGGEAWRHMLSYTIGTYSATELGWQLLQHALPWAPLALLALGQALRIENRNDIRSWYLVGTTLWLVSAARLGSGYPYFLDWQFAVLLSLAPPIQRLMANGTLTHGGRPRLWMSAFVAYLVVTDVVVAGVLAYDLRNGHETAGALGTLCSSLPAAPALTITESPGAARACGARAALQPFIIANLTRRGLWDEGPFLRDIANGRYPALLLPFDPTVAPTGVHADRWSPRVLDAMGKNYRPVREVNGWRLLEFSGGRD